MHLAEILMKAPSFSYSSISTFITCPKQYEANYVLKYIPFSDTEATLYGKDLHSAAEHYIGDETPLPNKYAYIKSYLDTLKRIPGEKLCEYKLAISYVDGVYATCDYESSDRYWRGIADLVIINGTKAYVVDYKTGKSAKYADTKQLALIAAALFLKYPMIESIKGMLLFVVAETAITETYFRENKLAVFDTLAQPLIMRKMAYESGVFNPTPNGLCKQWCKAFKCIHNGSYKDAVQE